MVEVTPPLGLERRDLALWDLLGLLRDEPVYQMIGGAVREEVSLYCTGIRPDVAKENGFIGGKMPVSRASGSFGWHSHESREIC